MLGMANGAPVQLRNQLGTYDGTVFISPVAPGNLQIHWPEGNVILPGGVTDPTSGVPDYNTMVTVHSRPASNERRFVSLGDQPSA